MNFTDELRNQLEHGVVVARRRARRRRAIAGALCLAVVAAAGTWAIGRGGGDLATDVATQMATATTGAPIQAPTPPVTSTATPTSTPSAATGTTLSGLVSEDWLAAHDLPDGFEFMGATQWPSHRTVDYGYRAATRDDPRIIRIGLYPGEPPGVSDRQPMELATGDRWLVQNDSPGLEQRFDWGVVRLEGRGVSLDEIIEAAESLIVVDDGGFPRPVLSTMLQGRSTKVAEGTRDGRPVSLFAASDGVRFALGVAQTILGPSGGNCCDQLGPDEAILVSISQGPIRSRFGEDGIADALYWGLVSPDATDVRFELNNGTVVTVAAEDLSEEFDVSFFIAGVPAREGEVVNGTATAIDADGRALGRTRIRVNGRAG